MILQGQDGELRLIEFGSGTTYYLEVLFCEMDFSGSQLIPHTQNVFQTMSNGTEDLWDALGGHTKDMAHNDDRLQITHSGHYEVHSNISFDGAQNDVFHVAIAVNDIPTKHVSEFKTSSGDTVNLTVLGIVTGSAGDFIRLMYKNNEAGNDMTLKAGTVLARWIDALD